jgi:hypothetical protein
VLTGADGTDRTVSAHWSGPPKTAALHGRFGSTVI